MVRAVGDGTRDGLTDPPRRVGRELVAATVLELVHGLHQADVAFLDQVQELQAAVRVLLGDRDHQAQVGLGHFALGLASLGFAGGHALVDVLQVLERQHHAGLQVDQLLLQFLHGGDLALQRFGVRMAGSHFVDDPLQVGFVAREHLDEMRARHAGTVHTRVQDGAFELAHFFHPVAQRVGQLRPSWR